MEGVIVVVVVLRGGAAAGLVAVIGIAGIVRVVVGMVGV